MNTHWYKNKIIEKYFLKPSNLNNFVIKHQKYQNNERISKTNTTRHSG